MIHIKYLTPQFLGNIEIMNIIFKPGIDFTSFKFLITGLCNSCANTSFAFTLALLLAPVSAFLTKILYKKLANSLDIYHVQDLVQFHKFCYTKLCLKQFSQLNLYYQHTWHYVLNKLYLICFYRYSLNHLFCYSFFTF